MDSTVGNVFMAPNSLRILVVGMSPRLLETLVPALRSSGVDVVVAEGTGDALEYLLAVPAFDAVLSWLIVAQNGEITPVVGPVRGGLPIFLMAENAPEVRVDQFSDACLGVFFEPFDLGLVTETIVSKLAQSPG